jgi:hypothetical protein
MISENSKRTRQQNFHRTKKIHRKNTNPRTPSPAKKNEAQHNPNCRGSRKSNSPASKPRRMLQERIPAPRSTPAIFTDYHPPEVQLE